MSVSISTESMEKGTKEAETVWQTVHTFCIRS